jgi:hypothetical protein
MVSYREADEIGRDPVRVRNLALSLLKLAETEEDFLSAWEIDFLRDIEERYSAILALTPKQKREMKDSLLPWERDLAQRNFRLTTLQAEKLLEIRDATILHRDIYGISVRNLIEQCHLARLDLDEDDEEFIERHWQGSAMELRRNGLSRLKRCSRQLGHLEDHM